MITVATVLVYDDFFASTIGSGIPVSKDSTDATISEVNSMKYWAARNRMTLNLSKNVGNAGAREDY